MAQQELSVSQIIVRVVDALSMQLEVQAELFKAEVAHGLSTFVQDLGPVVLAVAFVGLGYTFVCIGAVLTLAKALGLWSGFLLVGVVNMVLGGLTLARVANRVQSRQSQLDQDYAAPPPAEAMPSPSVSATQNEASYVQ